MSINNTTQEAEPAALSSRAPQAASKWLATVGLFAGLGAIVASSCCVIPLGLVAVGAGASILGGLEVLAEWRVPLLSISALAISGGWGAWWLKRPFACASEAGCVPPRRSPVTLTLLLAASIALLAAASWTYLDPLLLKLLRGR